MNEWERVRESNRGREREEERESKRENEREIKTANLNAVYQREVSLGYLAISVDSSCLVVACYL